MTLVLEIFGFAVGILYLWWEYHADARVWFASMVMPLISMWIYFNKGIYADFGINIYYFVMAIYGYVAWTRSPRRADAAAPEAPSLKIRHAGVRAWLIAIAALAAIWAALAWFLMNYTDSTVPVADGFTTALSIVATWMMARKYAEQWLAWLVVDAVCVGLYAYKGLIFYPILYGVYTVIAAFGYRKWLRLMREDQR